MVAIVLALLGVPVWLVGMVLGGLDTRRRLSTGTRCVPVQDPDALRLPRR